MKASLELASKKNRNGLYEIYVRIQDGIKKRRIKANCAVAKYQFKGKNHNLQWVRNHPNAHKINADLKFLIEQHNDVVLSAKVGKKILTPESVIHKANKVNEPVSLIKFMEIKISQMLEYNQRKGYIQSLNKWKAFCQKQKLGDLDFREIDVYIIKSFENYLFKKGLSDNTVYGDLKRIRSCFNMAIKEQLIAVGDYVFKAYTMPKVKRSTKEKLTIQEYQKFRDLSYSNESLIKTAQQAFLLAYNLAGARVEDILTLTWDNIKKDRIEYRMSKTGAINSFQITPQINDILNYFKNINKNNSKLIVPLIKDDILIFKNSKIEKENEMYKKEIGIKTAILNKYLKKIASDAEIEKKITTHVSRHSFASIAIKKSNGDINFVQNALKHSSPKITQIYLADLDNESMDEKMKNVTDI
ncbi:MAG: tyrosine-type recombinase/integrase [Bacteroidota bacterium]|jgi:integrase/recombinase XerD